MRLGLENGPLDFEIDYYAANSAELSAGTIKSPPNLTITLNWDDESSDCEETLVFVGRNVEAGFSVSSRLSFI